MSDASETENPPGSRDSRGDDELPLAERVEVLERSVEALHERFDALEERLDGRRNGKSSSPQATPSRWQRVQRRLRAFDWDGEQWLSRLGIALLLFGVGFFFKFSVEQGWLRPPVRVTCGVAAGAGLGALGAQVRGSRPLLGQMLMGGAGAVLYATVFAAYGLYGLIGSTGALAGAAVVAALTAWRALEQHDAALAVVGALGALGAPVLLHGSEGGLASVAGLVGYTGLVLAGGAAVYFFEGWRSLLYTVAIGGWATLAFIYWRLPEGGALFPQAAAGHGVLQGGIVFAWLLFWGVPVGREVVQARQPGGWAGIERETPSSLAGAFLFRPPAHTLAFSSPLVALAFSRQLWTLASGVWGLVALGAALAYALAYLGLHETEDALVGLAQAHGLAAAVLCAYGLSELVGGETFLLALAAEAGALVILARTLRDRALRLTGHAFFAVTAALLAGRLLFEGVDGPVSATALSRLGVVGIGAAAAMHVLAGRARRVYQAGALVLLLGGCWRHLGAVPGGEALVTASWGAVAVALLARGTRGDIRFWRNAALAVIAALVAKLFLVDLARLAAVWRVALFVGFGALFLALSYAWPGERTGEAGRKQEVP